MIKLKELINEYGAKTSELVGTDKGPFGSIYKMIAELFINLEIA